MATMSKKLMSDQMLSESVRRYLRRAISSGEFDDPYTGEVELTKAAESCFAEFPKLPSDSELPYELAYEIAESLGR